MGWGERVRAAARVAACLVCCAGPSPALSDEDETHLLLFSGRDLWRSGAFLYGGLIFSPGGFDDSGFLLKLLYSGGAYRYRASDLGGERVIGVEAVGHVAPGFLIKRGSFEGKFFFGLEQQNHWLWPDDPGNKLRGHNLGLRMSFDIWYEPTPNTMIAADGSLTSVGANYSGRVGAGVRVFDQFYVGPETQVYGGDGYRQFRLGAHITSMKTDTTEWSAAVGWSIDTDKQSSPYVRLGVLQRVN